MYCLDLSTAELELNCGFPILVVATKADLLVTDDLVTSRKHKELHGYFRSICLKGKVSVHIPISLSVGLTG